MRKRIFCLVLFLFLPRVLFSEEDYLLPLKENRGLSSVFADHRDFHFHSGIDFKTGGKSGLEVYAAKSGWVYRLVASWWGYGKAVYLRHPDGRLTVYAHLSDFSKKLVKLVSEKQLQDRSYKVDIFLEDTVWIKRGEVIGYSGESGNGAPHLHFEMRDENNRPLNPLTNGVSIQDTYPPVLKSIVLRPLGIKSTVEGSTDYKIYPLHFDSTQQVFLLKEIPAVEGNIGIELSAYDKMKERGNEFGIYRLELFADSFLIFSSHYDSIDFENTWKVELDRDFELLQKKEGEFYRLYNKRGNDLPLYHLFNQGVLNFNEDSLHQLTIQAQDASGNISKAKLLIRGGRRPFLSEVILKKNVSNYTIRGNIERNGLIRKVSVEASPLDKISWKRLSLTESINPLEGFNILLGDLGEEPMILRVKAVNDFEMNSDYVYLIHNPDKVTKEATGKVISEVNYFLKDSYWIFGISFNQMLGEIPEVFLQSGELKVLPLSSRQLDIKTYQFIFPFFELYLPGVVLQIQAFDIYGNKREEVKYLDVFLAKRNSKAIAESLDGEARVDIDSGSVFENIDLSIKRLEKPKRVKQRFISPLYSFSPSTIPLAKPALISISYKGKDCEPSKTGLYEYKENSFKFIGGEIDTLNKSIYGKVRNLTTCALIEDLKSPRIKGVFPKSGQKVKGKNLVISAWIKDELSGIGNEIDIEVLLDGEWLIPEYDPEKFVLVSKPLKVIKPGWHQMIIKAKDRMGNEKVVTNEFKVIK